MHSISDPSTQQELCWECSRASAPSAPVRPHSTSPCSPGGLALPGPFTSHSFALVQFLGIFAPEVVVFVFLAMRGLKAQWLAHRRVLPFRSS